MGAHREHRPVFPTDMLDQGGFIGNRPAFPTDMIEHGGLIGKTGLCSRWTLNLEYGQFPYLLRASTQP